MWTYDKIELTSRTVVAGLGRRTAVSRAQPTTINPLPCSGCKALHRVNTSKKEKKKKVWGGVGGLAKTI